MKFCHFYSLAPFPASPSAIAAFIVLVSCSVESHHTINNYLNALQRLQILGNFDVTAFDDIQDKLTQKGLENSMVHVPHRKAPLTLLILLQFHAHFNVRDLSNLALWSAFVVGFFTFFRTAILVPSSLGKFSPHNALLRGSVTFTGSGALLTVTRTKTRHSGNTALVVPIPRIPGSPLCHTLALSSLPRAVPASDTHPLFTFTTSLNRFNCITAKSLNNGIKHLASLFLWILVIFLVTVSVAEELLSPFSAIFRLNLSNLKETGDLTLTCCTYPCLWQTDSCFVISFHSTFAIVICS